MGRNPLSGKHLLQRGEAEGGPGPGPRVAIPFRGSISCNGTPLRTSSWTVLLEGGFVRIMKAGIYTWRIKGVLRGLARCEATAGAVDKQVETHIALAQGENWLSRSPSGFPDTLIIAPERNA